MKCVVCTRKVKINWRNLCQDCENSWQNCAGLDVSYGKMFQWAAWRARLFALRSKHKDANKDTQ
jgi:hypothetical protein